jgi:DNA gyrase, A subunit
MTLDADGRDEVIGMITVPQDTEETILVISEKGYGKRSLVEDYRITNRGTKGVKTLNITDKTGELVAIRPVTDEHDLMIINKSGITIRVHARDISVQGRATQGVRIIDLKKRGDEIASVCQVLTEEDSDEEAFDAESLPENESATPITEEEGTKSELPQELIDRALAEDNQ